MADNILRLKVQSDEYDAKLKKAAEGIRHLAEVAHQGGGELTGLEKAELDYVKALGEMETKSRTAAGSVRELESTYKELKVIYDQLNDVEKADEGGKALAASLEQIKTRAQEARAQLENASKSLNDNGQSAQQSGGILEALAGKFTLNIDALKLFDMGLSATKAALDVAKDAFFNNEEQLDEWGRVVESSHSLYTGFLNALNTGDISGYLSNISQIVQAARDAYDALDNLGTYNAFNQINVERTRTNMTESIADYRGGKGTKDAVKAAGEAYKKELQDRKRLENDAYLAAVKRVAAERGVSAKDLTDALSGTYGHYQDLKNVQPTGVRQTVVGAGMYARTGTETFAQTRQEKLGEALRHLNDTELQSLQALGAQAQRTGTEIAQVDKQLTRVLNGRQPGDSGGGTGGKGGKTTKEDIKYADDSIMAQEKLIGDLTQKWKTASGELREGYLKQLDAAKAKMKEMTAVDNTPAFTMTELEGTSPQSIDLRGNNGKAQDNADIALAKFATSGTSNVDFSSYTSALQNAIKDANVGSEIYAQLSEQLSDSSQVSQLLQQYIANGITGAELGQTAQELKDKLMSGEIDDSTMQTYVDQLNEQLKTKFSEEEWPNVLITFDADTKKIVNAAQQQQKEAQEMAKDWRAAGSAIQAVGAAMNQIEDPAAKVLGTIAQAVATMAMSYAQASLATAPSGWGWIAFAATGLATMMTSINAIKQATAGFAGGGIYDSGGFVPGTRYSGDLIPANGGTVGLNSGELILNRAQQGVIAQELEGGSFDNLQLDTRVTAEEIIFILNNNGNRRGYGDFIND